MESATRRVLGANPRRRFQRLRTVPGVANSARAWRPGHGARGRVLSLIFSSSRGEEDAPLRMVGSLDGIGDAARAWREPSAAIPKAQDGSGRRQLGARVAAGARRARP